MAENERTDPTAAPPAGANGHAPPADPRREEYLLRVQVAKLRNWCRSLLGPAGTDGVLPEAVVRDLTETPPEMTEDEVLGALRGLAFGEPVPPSGTEADRLPARITELGAERERLRQTFFTLFDAAFPDDKPPTEEEMLAEMAKGPGVPMGEVLAELEREFGGQP